MADEKRLIDANALKTKVFNLTLYVPWLRFGKTAINIILESYRKGVFEEIDNAPTVDAVEVVHGRWVSKIHKNILGDYFRFHCSECGDDKPNSIHINYCPNCGAKMDGGNEDV